MSEVIVWCSKYRGDDWFLYTDFSGEMEMKILHRLRSHPQEIKGKKAFILYNVRITANGFTISAEFILAGDLPIREVISPTARMLTYAEGNELRTLYRKIPNKKLKEMGEDTLKLFSFIKEEAQDFFTEISEEAWEVKEDRFLGNTVIRKEAVINKESREKIWVR